MKLKLANFLVIVFVAMATGAPSPGLDNDVVHDLMLQLCGWESSQRGHQFADKLKQSLGVGDGVLTSVSCNEAPPQEQVKVPRRVVQPRVQKQVIFIEMEESPVVYVPPAAPPRVVVYVFPREERHVFNVVDTRAVIPPMVNFLGNSFGKRMGKALFDIIPAINYDY